MNTGRGDHDSVRDAMNIQSSTRRQFFETCGVGLGKVALASLFASEMQTSAQAAPFTPSTSQRGFHHPPKAKQVIFLFMAGAPSQLELFDYKPKLVELEGQSIPPSVIAGQRYAFIQPDAAVLAPRFKFAKHGGLRLPSFRKCCLTCRASWTTSPS